MQRFAPSLAQDRLAPDVCCDSVALYIQEHGWLSNLRQALVEADRVDSLERTCLSTEVSYGRGYFYSSI
uniref:Uncharacterized protein n=1 Tax=Hyaloperonospora arabidopsidis (strain Emoy2) TaxID=559515 RepID=M4B2R0_HYAAE